MAGAAASALRAAGRHAVDVIYPRRCSGCGCRGTWLCDECDEALALFAPPWCARCGVPVELGACRCDRMPDILQSVRSVGPFEGWLRGAIVGFKYHAEWGRAPFLAEALARSITTLPACDALVPVPLHPARLRQRGFNQSELLAEGAAPVLGVALCEPLVRQRRTAAQVGLDAEGRRANVNSAFIIDDPTKVKGRALVLIDDVITTGSTLAACAEVLYDAGAESVSVATLAREL